jgi:hypothetical protein
MVVKSVKLIDAIGIALIIAGIVMTAINFFTVRGPDSDVISSTIEEIAPASPPPVRRLDRIFGFPIALFTTAPPHHQESGAYNPWRMKNWIVCLDGKQFYSQESSSETCLEHGGLRAYGPGKRLDE